MAITSSAAPEFSGPEYVDISRLNVRGVSGYAHVQVFERPAATISHASEVFDRDGVSVLGRSCEVSYPNPIGDDLMPTTIDVLSTSVAINTIRRLQQLWRSPIKDEVFKKKTYQAYNDTARNMVTVSYQSVLDYLPSVIRFQHNLKPLIAEIINDNTVDVSTDPGEGTVINLQLFDPDANDGQRREHGAHTDRVDTTVIVPLANYGEHGDFVYLKGYNDACLELGLDRHRDFSGNLGFILERAPELVVFRIYPVQPGLLSIIRTDQDVHLITPKTRGDVRKVERYDQPPRIGNLLLARGVINAAFETEACRQLHHQTKEINQRAGDISGYRGADFFAYLDAALNTEINMCRLDPSKREEVRNAFVTAMSADQLYRD